MLSGCKIKALRAKTNTYIKTPVRGEEPVFVVTGRKDDVQAAKREILSAAEHFSQIRASRRNSSVSSITSNGMSGPPSPNAPGQVTIQVRVPYRVVGLVVGPKGATIKRIQQQTQTYIVTPSRDKEPVFEVSGLPENVDKARHEIESHIALRTGGLIDNQPEDDFHRNGIDSGFHELNGSSSDCISSLFGKTTNGMSAFTAYNNVLNGNNFLNRRPETVFNFPPVSSNTSKMTDFNGQMNVLGTNFTGFPNIYDGLTDEGIGSPTFESGVSSNVWSDVNDNRNPNLSIFGNTNTSSVNVTSTTGLNGLSRISPTSSEMSTGSSATGTNSTSHSPPSEHPAVRRIRSDPLASAFAPFNLQAEMSFPTTSGSVVTTTALGIDGTVGSDLPCTASAEISPIDSRRNCIMCSESEVVSALVPCGHNFFCMECASLIVEKPAGSADRLCPVCKQEPSQAIRIIS